jgi:hypothetical protein
VTRLFSKSAVCPIASVIFSIISAPSTVRDPKKTQRVDWRDTIRRAIRIRARWVSMHTTGIFIDTLDRGRSVFLSIK